MLLNASSTLPLHPEAYIKPFEKKKKKLKQRTWPDYLYQQPAKIDFSIITTAEGAVNQRTRGYTLYYAGEGADSKLVNDFLDPLFPRDECCSPRLATLRVRLRGSFGINWEPLWRRAFWES